MLKKLIAALATALFCTGYGAYQHCTEYCYPQYGGGYYCTVTTTPANPPVTKPEQSTEVSSTSDT
jgi:hypothetical protein